MNTNESKRIVASNAGIWVIAILASFVLPMVAVSMTEGRSEFLKMLAHVAPLFIGMAFSTWMIGKATKA